MNASDIALLLEESRHNIGLELSRFENVGSQREWLVDHLGIYLRRLDGFCEHLDEPPRAFLQSSLYCNIQVVSAHIDRILCEQERNDNNWTALTESFSALPDAASMTQCVMRH